MLDASNKLGKEADRLLLNSSEIESINNEIPESVSGSATWNNYVVYLPVTNENGKIEKICFNTSSL